MSRAGRSYLVFEALVAVGLALAATRIPAEVAPLTAVTQFLLIMAALSLFDVWLPHGDTVDIVGPLAFGALVLLGPTVAVGVAAGSRLLAHVLRYRFDHTENLLHGLSRRTIVIAACGFALNAVARTTEAASPEWYVGVTAVAAALVLLDLVVQQAYAAARQHQAIGALLLGNLRLQGLMLAAQVSVAVLAVILYPEMGVWALGLLAILLFVMRQSFSLLLDIRQAYQSTMEALAAALEAHDPSRQGHAERVAALARAIGLEVGLRGKDLERLGYAALLHDVDLMAVDRDEEGGGVEVHTSPPSEILADVGFLAEVLPVLRLCEGQAAPEAPESSRLQLIAYIVCRASNLDELLQQDSHSSRQYPQRLLTALLDDAARERVEKALWKLLTPGARIGA